MGMRMGMRREWSESVTNGLCVSLVDWVGIGGVKGSPCKIHINRANLAFITQGGRKEGSKKGGGPMHYNGIPDQNILDQ